MCLETKFQPFQFRNYKDIGCRIDVHGAGMTCTPLYISFSAHEITHAFDDSGIMFDHSGANKPLYDNETVERSEPFYNLIALMSFQHVTQSSFDAITFMSIGSISRLSIGVVNPLKR